MAPGADLSGSAFLKGISMLKKCLIFGVLFTVVSAITAPCQDLSSPGALVTRLPITTDLQTIALTVPKGTPLQIVLDQEVRVKKVGQPIHGHTVEPIYAFDRQVVPVGAEVAGRIIGIENLSKMKRTLGALNADFTPKRKVDIEFDELDLAQGKQIALHADVMPWSGQVMQLVSPKNEKNKGATSAKMDQAKQEARRQWQDAMQEVKAPGRIHRLERYAISQLPMRPQYIDAGTVYIAELKEPIEFGSERLTLQQINSIGTTLPKDSLIHALLVTPLNSATATKGEEIQAVLAQPLFDGNKLILPAGSRLTGSVLAAQPAKRLHHNGQLRITFLQITPPDGITQKIVASLESVQAGKNDNIKLDSEGGAEASTPKTRYLSTGLSLALASTSFKQHTDDDDVGGSQQGGVGGGAAGFKLVGIVVSALVKSQPLGMAMGAYGASRSVYSHFIARGQDVVFPKNTVMEIGIGNRGKTVLTSPEQNNIP
jgi:type IV secretory pathway VirB10-like protein